LTQEQQEQQQQQQQQQHKEKVGNAGKSMFPEVTEFHCDREIDLPWPLCAGYETFVDRIADGNCTASRQ
jgi:hypothetical protein